MPENEEVWDELDIMFATSHGTVRRNKLSDFRNIRANGLIAMKLGDGEGLSPSKSARKTKTLCWPPATARPSAFRFPTFAFFRPHIHGRSRYQAEGQGRRGDLHVDPQAYRSHPEERSAYMKAANRIIAPEEGAALPADEEAEEISGNGVNLTDERYRELLASEQLVLTVTSKGFGKRTSAYEYRVSGRGGQGLPIWP